jgi:hypothetical protein
MLYFLARRYDEFRGERDDGSSLRGALKGWFHHGLALESEWRDLNTVKDLEDEDFTRHCAERPLGAYYRVNALRLDDMQSAINELHAIVASAVVDNSWAEPIEMKRGKETLYVIMPAVDSGEAGGHAFAIVGYNEVGFLVQNSWGSDWGKDGFATLPYEAWLDNAYDAWVVRPGVPKTPFASGRDRTLRGTGQKLVTAPGLDTKRLAAHVVNIANDGRLSQRGKFVSSPAQIERVFQHMELWHDAWLKDDPSAKRHVVLYAHGGLVSESGGLATAQKHLNWWLNNRIYPINFAWQSGAVETLIDHLVDEAKKVLPFGGIGIDLTEQFDRLTEKMARSGARFLWDEMKENARKASVSLTPAEAKAVRWPPTDASSARMTSLPAASLTATRLAKYADKYGAAVRIHLVGHSAGSIFHAGLLPELARAKLKVDSLTLLAPAIRMDEFARDVLPRLGGGKGTRFATFAMTNRRELDDVCAGLGVRAYHKSLLYLVSRALESSESGGEVPLVGMEKFAELPTGGMTLRAAIEARGGEMIFAPTDAPARSRSDASSHGGFDDDTDTMTSVAMRILDTKDIGDVEIYKANAPLKPNQSVPQAPQATETAIPVAQPVSSGLKAAFGKPAASVPLTKTAESQTVQACAPLMADGTVLEVAAAPRSGRPILDIMQVHGWKSSAGADTTSGSAAANGRKRQRNGKSPSTGGRATKRAGRKIGRKG